jgi:DNA-binding NarL/FixJ family response regulator
VSELKAIGGDVAGALEQIAEKLRLSPETVRNHVFATSCALGVHSRLEAVALARRERLV